MNNSLESNSENNLIENNYFVINNYYNDDFSIIIYYLDSHKCKILIRRLDNYNWGQDLKINIMDMENDKSEMISLGSCDENFKMIEYYTTITLIKKNYNTKQKIPKVIIQTSNYNMNHTIYHYNSVMTFIELNPEYKYTFFTDNECRQFIKENIKELDKDIFNFNVGEILNAYDLLIPGTLKCDIFKYLYLYLFGGCYFHCKTILKKPLFKIIKEDDSIILCNDEKSYYSGVICVEKENDFIFTLLQLSLENIITKKKGETPYDITRKLMFYESEKKTNVFSSKLIRFKDNIYVNNNNFSNENIVLRIFYKDYYQNYYNTFRDLRYLWNKNLIFYKYNFVINNYHFYYFLECDKDTFEITNLKSNIFSIKRTDAKSGWGQKIQLKIIYKDIVFSINVGSSNENEKKFFVEKI
jgi:hypothetical protein